MAAAVPLPVLPPSKSIKIRFNKSFFYFITRDIYRGFAAHQQCQCRSDSNKEQWRQHSCQSASTSTTGAQTPNRLALVGKRVKTPLLCSCTRNLLNHIGWSSLLRRPQAKQVPLASSSSSTEKAFFRNTFVTATHGRQQKSASKKVVSVEGGRYCRDRALLV